MQRRKFGTPQIISESSADHTLSTLDDLTETKPKTIAPPYGPDESKKLLQFSFLHPPPKAVNSFRSFSIAHVTGTAAAFRCSLKVYAAMAATDRAPTTQIVFHVANRCHKCPS